MTERGGVIKDDTVFVLQFKASESWLDEFSDANMTAVFDHFHEVVDPDDPHDELTRVIMRTTREVFIEHPKAKA